MRPALRRANMKDFWSLHEEVKNGSNKYLRLTGSCVMPKLNPDYAIGKFQSKQTYYKI